MTIGELANVLDKPKVRWVVGTAFAVTVSWYLLFGGSASDVWFSIYGVWLVAIILLVVRSLSDTESEKSKDSEHV